MNSSSFVQSGSSFGRRSAFSPYKPAKTNCSQVLTPVIMPHTVHNNLYRYLGFQNTMMLPVIQKRDSFVNTEYQSAEYYEDRLMRNDNARRRRKAEKKREEAMRDRIHILEYENDQMRQEIEYLRLKLQTREARGEKSM
ncbi:hypothetical protein PRIPAC_79889 [Pristionchus pacificus]|uniref:Uncharacterized protein n=1 Tax=Pristionchus pacificus TaxID=54126 RepID=A0A2A6C3A0_PRIPA|nr:hypothetical protein PRIPAC_79889 [Pristionchus pacificus]|eukprot:PDM72501.1 hypothetical protein PRIPAC_38935 [Pristionchus pacificus]